MSDDVLLFFAGHTAALPLYEALEGAVLRELPDTRIEVKRTQISFKNRHIFACASLLPAKRKAQRPDPYLTVTFGLDRPVQAPRVAVVAEAAPNRWTHHVLIGSPAQVDGELMGWICQAYRFSEGKR